MTYTKLLIVESPAKAKTINKYLGNEFIVLASFGHVRDLPKKPGSIDIDHDFAPKYQLITKNKKHVDEIIKAAGKCDSIYLATDPDREGEAIAWHILQILNSKPKVIANKTIKRVTFHEITKQAILQAISTPKDINSSLVDAQQARLTLDYLIGFNISPLLWRKIKPRLSAGRVQSPALRLICERDKEINDFIPEDYFGILMDSHVGSNKFIAKLIEHNGTKIDKLTVKTKQEAGDICQTLGTNSSATVINITKKQKKKNPLPPFITSSLQIEASRKLGFNTDKTMRVAQSLYEGVEIGSESLGLITYMRTDSVNLSDDAISEIRHYISDNYAKAYLPKSANKFISKVKNAQEAHEAIRTTSIKRTPKTLKKYLSADQYKLYELIWLRSLASQFSSALLDTTAVDFSVAKSLFRVNGVIVNFDGFMKVYKASIEEKNVNGNNTKETGTTDEDENSSQLLPEFILEQSVPVDKIFFTEHQTEPKPRYSEASLVKSLEELGIGRPSTYASIISTLKKREYVIMDKKRFFPTDIGTVVNGFLTKHLTNYVDFKFTANLEDTLDDISNGKEEKLPMLRNFWDTLSKLIQEKQNIARSEVVSEKIDENCPQCGKQLITRLGKYGKFVGCSGYPDCKYIRNLDGSGNNEEPTIVEGKLCPKDGAPLAIRIGRFGKFISCTNYPKCDFRESLDKIQQDEVGVKCPECKTGDLTAKKNRYGNLFYSCNNYPTCKTIFNHKPIHESCPSCNYPVLMHKVTKTKGEQKVCPKCKHTIDLGGSIKEDK